jgi:aminoglycoside phosphotransferase
MDGAGRRLMKLPHGYTNETRLEAGVVTKHYAGTDAAVRLEIEARTLERLKDLLPVPSVLGIVHDALDLELEEIKGRPGQDLIVEGQGAAVLRSCGELLRRIQSLPPTLISRSPRAGDVIVHGDFGPQNLLYSADGSTVVGILDWEWTHLAGPIEDLAWAEWIVRVHHPGAVHHLNRLFEGYGEVPAWQYRHRSMIERCEEILEIVRSNGDEAAKVWEERVKATARFRDL